MRIPYSLNSLLIPFLFLISTSFTSQASPPETAALLTNGAAINTAGRQRMLSERMVKAYIQLSIEVDMQKAQVQLHDASQLFQQQLQQLITYAPTSNITHNLDAVQQQWAKVSLIVQAPPKVKKIPELIALGEQLVARSHQVVLNIQQFSGTSSAVLVNISGRQRMLSQRMAKYYFAHLAGQRQSNTIKRFETSLAEFEKGLTDLMSATENSPEITKALKKVDAQLKFSKSGFKQLEKGNYAPHVISRTTESMLKRMENITHQYASLHDKQQPS
jgi:nitrate/nitrite-specific signal transduction histidine kinase